MNLHERVARRSSGRRCREPAAPVAQAGATRSVDGSIGRRGSVPASELAAARAQITKLQRVLGKKTLENEILKEAVAYAAEKSGLHARPCRTGTTSEGPLPGPWVGALEQVFGSLGVSVLTKNLCPVLSDTK